LSYLSYARVAAFGAIASDFATGSDTGLMGVGDGFAALAAIAMVAAALALYLWNSSS
jgi:hypothetical protein